MVTIPTSRFAAIAAATEWTAESVQSCYEKLPWYIMLLDCFAAFGFSVTMVAFVGKLSAVSYSIYSLLKDIVLVTLAFLCFREHVPLIQIFCWVVTIAGCAVWNHRSRCRGR